MTQSCCEQPGRAGCWVVGSRRPRRWERFLRAFTFGHVRQLDALLGEALVRAWRAGAGPGEQRLVIDVDSFVGEVCGRLKQGAAYGYTKLLGYHPILATRADTREVLHIRLSKGSPNTQKGMLRFTDELIARVNRCRRQRREAVARRLGVLERQGVLLAAGRRLAVLDRCPERSAADPQTHSAGRSASITVARLAAFRVHHQPHRRHHDRRG